MAQIQSGEGPTLQTIDPVSRAARVTLYDDAGNMAVLAADDEPATVSGAVLLAMNDRAALPVRSDRLGSVAVATHLPLFTDSFEGTTVNPLRWTITATTMAATQSSAAGVTINSGAITTINTGYMLQSARRFLKTQRSPLQAKKRARLVHFNNSVMEIGFGDAATFNGANTTGAYWQRQANGALVPVVTYNGVDLTGANVAPQVNNNDFYTFDVFLDDDEAVFTLQNTSTGLILSKQRITMPVSAQRLWSSTGVPLIARVFNTGVAPATAPQMILTDAYVAALDADLSMPAPDVFAGLSRGFTDNPFTGAQIAQWGNNAAPANATLSNTAAGYATLGGLFQFAAVAGAVTDYALFAIQIPAPANFFCTGVDIETWNTGAAVATTPTLLVWGLAAGAGGATLAAGTPNRIGLGAQSFAVGAAIGAKAERISKQFRTPVFVPSGRFLHIILRMPIATATASQVLAGMVNIEGYFA